jgi:ComF family protein
VIRLQRSPTAVDFHGVLLDLLLPQTCLGCQALLWHPAQLPLCGRCAPELVALPANERTHAGITALFAYEGPLQQALTRLKYHGSLAWAGPLGALLGPELRGPGDARWDAIVPMPLHWRRLLSRGFNQSLVLSRVAMRSRPRVERVPIRAGWLRRRRATPPQAGLDAATRRRNLRGAFVVARPRAVRGRRILLIDDVTTTGATLTEAIETLRQAGAAEVAALALLRGGHA